MKRKCRRAIIVVQRHSSFAHFPFEKNSFDSPSPWGWLGVYLPSMDWAEKLVKEQEWFIQKAVAWHVRELSKQFPVAARKFLEKFRGDMKPFALREAGKYL